MLQADSYDGGDDDEPRQSNSKKSNVLPLWGNERTMNLNPLILTNIQSSHYFKVNLYELKTYHEVIDEIYYKVSHLEPWEKGSRKTAGQTGMCGGVRGVGAGGIVSTAYCLLYKLFTLKLTRKQVNGLITHTDSPYIRGLGFMYIRYTQPPADLWDWYEDFLEDDEELDVKAGGGQNMTIGEVLRNFLCKLEWFSTLFPRIPVPIQQKIEKNMTARFGTSKGPAAVKPPPQPAPGRHSDQIDHSAKVNKKNPLRREYDDQRREKDWDRERDRDNREKDWERDRERDRDNREKDWERERDNREKDWERERERDRDRDRERERESRNKDKDKDYERDRERDRNHRDRRESRRNDDDRRDRDRRNRHRHRSRSRSSHRSRH